jgi:hypothetical protein
MRIVVIIVARAAWSGCMSPENDTSEPHRPPDEARRPLRVVPESEDSSPTGSVMYVRHHFGSLPKALTSFVGREREVGEVGLFSPNTAF